MNERSAMCPFHALLGLEQNINPAQTRTKPKHLLARRQVNLDAAISAAEEFIKQKLPQMNKSALAGNCSLADFRSQIIRIIKPFSESLFRARRWGLRMPQELVAVPTREHARMALKLIGFLVDSFERHSQS